MNRTLAALVFFVGVGATAWKAPALDAREAAILHRWFACIDCSFEVDSIRAIANRKPDATIDSLNAVLVSGITIPAGANDALGRSYARDSAYRVTHSLAPIAQPRAAYVTEQIRRYVDGGRARSAEALGRIHTTPALAALNAALALPLTPAMRHIIMWSLTLH